MGSCTLGALIAYLSVSAADGNFKPEGCYYEVFGISQARAQMRSKWMVISGGSNAILTAIAVGNVMEPDGESLPTDD